MADGTSSCVKGWLAKCACRLRQGLVPAMIKTRLATMNVNGAGIWWIRLEYRDRLLGRWSSRLFTAAARQGIGNEKGLGPARAHSATVAAAARWLNGKALSPSPDRGCSTAACKVSRLSRRFSAGFGHPRPVAGSNVPRHSLTTPASHPAGSCVIGERQCPIQEDAHVRASDTYHTIRP
jgi:hypothetical protein